ncbi:MAG: hypothetical protein RLZZ603_650, partial [Actinomycetota bacterium]
TSRVGNRVMGELRVKLFSHLQRMELAFFTRTKTGVIQSRLQNDVGGVANVLSNTISTVLGNTVTVLAAMVAMVLLNWKLTIVAMFILPLMVLLQRKVGSVRAKIAGKTQESLLSDDRHHPGGIGSIGHPAGQELWSRTQRG